ncbi:MAG: Ger(x)C family spore germination protein [Peptococcaceae bacterium]
MKKKLIYLLLIPLVILIAPACWDTMDINNRACVTAIGIDEVAGITPGQEGIPFKYKVTAEIIKPALLKEFSWKLEPAKTAGLVLTAEGETIEKALDLLRTNISRPLTLSHLQTLIIGEKAADHLRDICTYFEKHPEVARRLRLTFARNQEALDILKIDPKLESYLAEEFVGMAEVGKEYSLSTFKPFTTFLSEMRTNNGQTLGSTIFLDNRQSLIRSGSAIFSGWKLTGFLDGEETRKAGLLFPESKKSTFIGKIAGGTYTYEVDKKETQIIPNIQKGDLSFTVKLKTEGIILQEEGNQLYLAEPKNIDKLEHLFAEVITRDVKEALRKSQQTAKVDYFKFGMKLMNEEPDYFAKLDWQKVFPTVPITTDIKVKISRFGIAK